MRAAVIAALKNVTLDLPSFGHVGTELVLSRLFPDPSEGITHVVLQFAIKIELRHGST
jgi:hypothetical protein